MKRRLRLVLLAAASLAIWSGSARAAAALVQNNTATGTTSVTATWGLAGGVVAGHLLVATVMAASGSTIAAPAAWTLIASVDNPTKVMVAMYYIQNCAAKVQNATETFTATGSNGTTVRLMEFSGIATTGALDTSGSVTGGASSTLSVSTSGAVATSPELGVAVFAHQVNDTGANLAAVAPYSDVSTDTTTTNNVEDSTYNKGVTSGAVATAGATASGTAHSWAAIVAVFQEAPLYWRGGLTGCASGSLFTSTTCWSTSSGGASAGVTPGPSDRALFDGNGTGNCVLSSTAATQAGSITTTAAYTGTITQGTQNVSLSNDLSIGGGTFTGRSGQTIATNGSGSYNGGIVVSGGVFNGNGATIAVQSLIVSGGTFTAGAGNFSTNNGGGASFAGGTSTFSSGTVSLASTLSVAGAGTSVTFGSGAPTVGDLATFSAGTVTFGAGQLLLNNGLDVEGASVTFGSSASTTIVTGTVTVGSGTVNFTNGSAATDFSNTLAFTQSGGTINMAGATVALGSTIALNTGQAFIMSGGIFNNTVAGGSLAVGTSGGGGGAVIQSGASAVYNGVATATEIFNGPLSISGTMNVGAGSLTGGTAARKDVTINAGGTMTLSSAGFAFSTTDAMTIAGTLNAGTGTATFSPTVTVSGTLDGSSGTQNFANTLTVTGTLKTGTSSMTGGTAALRLVAISSGGTMTLSSAGFAFNSTTSMPIDGTLNAGSGTVTFAGPVALTGTLNANGATTTMTGALSMTGTSAFNGNTGTTTFSASPTLTAGTFTVGDAGSSGSVIFSTGVTFASGMTLAFPASGGTLSAPAGQAIAINGTVTSSAGGASTPPKIANTTGALGVTISFGATSVLKIDGLELDGSVASGVSIASGATYTLFKRLKFQNNVGGAGSTHLLITLGTAIVNAPGFFFDATAAHNVTLDGTTGHPAGARAIFEDQSVAVNGAGAGESLDQDGDTNGDNVGDNTATSPYFGSVVEWVGASETDTSGTAAGYPSAAFDWNTFSWYGIYVAYKDTAGAGTADVIWLRNNDGSAAYSYSVPQASGDLLGTPFWDTINETTAHVDANGNGNQTDTDVHVVYMATTLGHIIKLVDNGASLAPPASGPWSTDFTSATVATISSPLIEDGTNLYFGGTDGSAVTKVFGVQISGGANEKTLQKNVGSVGAVTATPSWAIYSGSTYVFLGSVATSSQAYVYRINMTSGTVNASFSGISTSVNASVRLINNRAYAVTDGGNMQVLDASNFNVGGFTNLTGFPYQSTAAQPIGAAPYVDSSTNYAYFGDKGGTVYAVTGAGANVVGYPFSISSAVQLSSSPIYLAGGGVIAIGANDGYIYFIDRHNASNVPTVFRRYFVTASGTVSTVAYDGTTSEYMVSSSDGKLMFVKAADVADPTASVE
jgi:hypothetical protein